MTEPRLTEADLVQRVIVCIDAVAKDFDLKSGGKIRRQRALEWAPITAPLLIKAARSVEPSLYLPYFMAYPAQESRFDPLALNPNFTDGNDPTRVDWGIGQFSGRNLAKDNVPFEKALDPAWAIPYMARLARSRVNFAKKTFPGSDPMYVGAMAYNKGMTGAEAILKNDRRIINRHRPPEKQMGLLEFVLYKRAGHKHAKGVMAFSRQFEKILRAPAA